MSKQQLARIKEGLAGILWDIDRPSYIPTWDEVRKSSHKQCQMDRKNTLIDATYILEYLDSEGLKLSDGSSLIRR